MRLARPRDRWYFLLVGAAVLLAGVFARLYAQTYVSFGLEEPLLSERGTPITRTVRVRKAVRASARVGRLKNTCAFGSVRKRPANSRASARECGLLASW